MDKRKLLTLRGLELRLLGGPACSQSLYQLYYPMLPHYKNGTQRNKMAARVHRPLKLIAFNANGIWGQGCEHSKQLQDLHIRVYVALPSETHLKTHERFFLLLLS
jgi:hypothetical protein